MTESTKAVASKVKQHVRSRLVSQNEFYDRLNERVFIPYLGKELPFPVARDIVHGIGDLINEITLAGQEVRFGKIGTFRQHVTPPGPRWDPSKKEMFQASERRKLAFSQSKSTKRLFDCITDDEQKSAS